MTVLVTVQKNSANFRNKNPNNLPWWTDARVSRATVNARSTILTNASFACIELILATNARIIIRTCTVQARTEITAQSIVHAWIANATFRCRFALFAIRSAGAHTEIVFKQIDTLGIILTLIHRTEFNFLFAIIAGPSIFANAFIRSGAIDTFTIHAWLIFAIVDIGFACGSRIASSTFAHKFIVQIDATFSAHWITWIAQAFIDFGFTLKTDIAWTTFAHETVDFIDTSAGVLAWVRFAIVDHML